MDCLSSDEEISFVMEQPTPSEETLEGIQTLITNYKITCDQLVQEQNDLAIIISNSKKMTQDCRKRSIKLAKSLQEDKQSHQEQMDSEMVRQNMLSQEEFKLMKEIQDVEAALTEEEADYEHLREQTDVFTSVPDKMVVFKGKTADPGNVQMFDMTSRIVYPMQEGTALITFEEEEVAKRILSMKKHQVKLDDECRITMEAQPVQLMLPRLVEIHSEVCPQRILISNLPKMDIETLLSRLQIHFHKARNGGGEVEHCEFLPDSGTVVLTFLENHIAKGLTDLEFHDIELQKKKHTVRVTPFLNGNIVNLETKMMVCPRTVLLTGIPQVEHDSLQDLVEIHFQRSGNGGGELEAFLYNPLGQHTTALFESIAPKKGSSKL
ncbi:interferon-induced protein 35 [Hippoglossus stenolepis]|uniref:interferon-induced protein 35 n=1 Tax=Hippoglossus stenolepis TaxID=195615 RepID=UPI001FAEE12C|nr:interferon-induced protein 35 [Hippoglossus stenolepis]